MPLLNCFKRPPRTLLCVRPLLVQTPIPLAYSRHTSRFLVLYLTTLPLALVGTLRWGTVPVMAVLCWALFGILEIGNLIEEPFTGVADASGRPLLPLTEICRTIRRDVRQIAQYATHAQRYRVPTIKRTPRTGDQKYPDSFKKLRQVLQNATAEGEFDRSGTNSTVIAFDKNLATTASRVF